MGEKLIEPTLQAELRASTRITDVETDEVRELILYVDDPSFRFRQVFHTGKFFITTLAKLSF